MSDGMEVFLNSPVVNYYQPIQSIQSIQKAQSIALYPVNEKQCEIICTIVPPHLTKILDEIRETDQHSLIQSHTVTHHHMTKDASFRKIRKAFLTPGGVDFQWPWHRTIPPISVNQPLPINVMRIVYDANHGRTLPGPTLLLSNNTNTFHLDAPDSYATAAMDNALNVFLFFLNNYKYNSIDGKNMPIISTIHYEYLYENAFWNGQQMIYGDGSEIFNPFVNYLDVVGHEMAHGVTGERLLYKGEAGALNEHFSDVMGYLVFLYTNHLGTDDPKATWTIADGIIRDANGGHPLRSFANPGHAYNTPVLGKDPQPAKYPDLYRGREDNGGVHINSGVPNHAFYLFAKQLGGFAWEKAGLIWFTTMMATGLFRPNASMADFAKATIKIANKLYSNDTLTDNALRSAWKTVEVLI